MKSLVQNINAHPSIMPSVLVNKEENTTLKDEENSITHSSEEQLVLITDLSSRWSTQPLLPVPLGSGPTS